MTDEKTHLSKVENAPVQYAVLADRDQRFPDRINDTALVITVILAIAAYLLLGLVGLIPGVLLVVAYLKRSKGEFDKAILYNKVSRVFSVIMIIIGSIIILFVFIAVVVYYAVVFPKLLGRE